MSSAYDQQIKKLVDHIQELNHALHERNMQIVQWQQVARTVQDERTRLARGLMDQVRQGLANFATRFAGLKSENKKLRAYVDHQRQLHDVVARDLQGQLKYALSRIDELARERAEWRNEVGVSRQAAAKYQQAFQEKQGVVASQSATIAELQSQLGQAHRFSEMEEAYKTQMARLEQELAAVRERVAGSDQTLAVKDRELRQIADAYQAFKARANEEVQAMQAELRRRVAAAESQLKANQASQGEVDERVGEMTALLANSEREVARLHRDLMEERSLRKEAEIRLEATKQDFSSTKRKLTKLEKEREAAKGDRLSDLQKALADMKADYDKLQQELVSAREDKTHYMQALEGQKGKKLRPLPPTANEGGE